MMNSKTWHVTDGISSGNPCGDEVWYKMDKVDNGMCHLSAVYFVNKWKHIQVLHTSSRFETRDTNILSISLTQAKASNNLKGVKVGRNGISFTHLLFANDSLSFFKKDNHSLATLQKILDWYCSVSMQCINPLKSDLFCFPNMPVEDQEALARHLKVNLVQNPSNYLGLNLS